MPFAKHGAKQHRTSASPATTNANFALRNHFRPNPRRRRPTDSAKTSLIQPRHRIIQTLNPKNRMTNLFRRINPAQKFRISKYQIAKLLQIPQSLIVKIESWLYVVFVHRGDKGGQFISYRQLEQWKNAGASHLQKCSTWEQLEHCWNAIKFDHTKHTNQYVPSVLPFLEKIWLNSQEAIPNVPQNTEVNQSTAPSSLLSDRLEECDQWSAIA